MYLRLRDLIRAVRCARTAADERSVIQKELAYVRTSLKETNSQDVRFTNIQKLLYIYLLGYPVQFGQLECLKLVASSRYSDKRVGYLGVMMLMDEKNEIITLLTNCVKNDLQSTDDYIVALALCTLSVLGTEEIARDLIDDVLRLIGSSRSFIRKKAVLTGLRLVHRVPESRELFLNRARQLLGDKSHGVQLGITAIVVEILQQEPEHLEKVRKLVPIIVRQLRGLLGAGAVEYDVGGLNDPFLQVGLLRLLRVLGTNSERVAEEINDVLTQVLTQTEESKNVGTAVLYECVRVVLAVPSEKSLRVLAINLLGKFLEHRENNVRYVALTMLQQAVATEATAVQRVQATVVQCLQDDDVSIRRLALDLTFALIGRNNVQKLTAKLIAMLPTVDAELRAGMTHKLFAVAAVFAPSPKWALETMLQTLYLAGTDVMDEDMFRLINDVASRDSSDGSQAYAARVGYAGLVRRLDVLGGSRGLSGDDKFVLAATWLLGEYGDLVSESAGTSFLAADDVNAFMLGSVEPLMLETPQIAQIVEVLQQIGNGPAPASSLALTSLAKLQGRGLGAASVRGQIVDTFVVHTKDFNVENQTRALQYRSMLDNHGENDVVQRVVERMPPPKAQMPKLTANILNPVLGTLGSIADAQHVGVDGELSPLSSEESSRTHRDKHTSVVDDLLGLMTTTAPISSSASQPQNPLADLLSDLSSLNVNATQSAHVSSSIQPTTTTTTTKSPLTTTNAVHRDLFSLASHQPTTTTTAQSPLPISSPNPHSAPTTSTISNNNIFGLGNTASANNIADTLAASHDDPIPVNKRYSIYSKNHLTVHMLPSKQSPSDTSIDILVTFALDSNSTTTTTTKISNLVFQAAVPKSQKLQMFPPSANALDSSSPSSVVTQAIKIANPSRVPIRLRLRLSFDLETVSMDGNSESRRVVDTFEFSSFDSDVI